MNITLFACKYTQLFRNCQIYPHFYVFVTNRLVLKQAGQGRVERGSFTLTLSQNRA